MSPVPSTESVAFAQSGDLPSDGCKGTTWQCYEPVQHFFGTDAHSHMYPLALQSKCAEAGGQCGNTWVEVTMSPVPSIQSVGFAQSGDLPSDGCKGATWQCYESVQHFVGTDAHSHMYPLALQSKRAEAGGQCGNTWVEVTMSPVPSTQSVAFAQSGDLPIDGCRGTTWQCYDPAVQNSVGTDTHSHMYPPALQSSCAEAGGQCGNMWAAPAGAPLAMAFCPSICNNAMWVPAPMYSTDQYGNTHVQTGVPMNCVQANLVWPVGLIGAQNELNGASSLQGYIWSSSRDGQGCRMVQQALDDAVSDDERIALASELRTHIWEALRCPNANYVVQKCISTLPPLDSQFILDEIVNVGPHAAARAARHRYGCRILQRALEHCSSVQVQGLVNELLSDAVGLATHIYGNYVLQHLLEHGSAHSIRILTILLAQDASSLVANSYGCGVLTKALESKKVDPQSQQLLANAMLAHADLVSPMACMRHGDSAVKLALHVADEAHRNAAVLCLMAQKNVLMASRYGRALYKHLQDVKQE